MATRRHNLFEELGLLTGEEPVNPYEILGLSPEFASSLLREDRSGESLRVMASGLHKLLSRRYHPDVAKSGDPERFRAINDAEEQIEAASLASLSRWTKAERVGRSIQLEKLQAQHELQAQRATELLQTNFDVAHHPEHFSQIPYNQGILLERQKRTLLVRSLPGGTLRVTQGVDSGPSGAQLSSSALNYGFDFQTFMGLNQSFGIEPDTKIAAYVDETGRASILEAGLSFRMDVTEPVRAYRETRKKFSSQALARIGSADLWSRSDAPMLFLTTVPGPKSGKKPSGRIVVFPEYRGDIETRAKTNWDVQAEVVGSIADRSFVQRIRHATQTDAVALASSQASQGHNYFNRFAFPTRKLIEDDTGYTPLLSAGNSLLLYDTELMMPIATDTSLIGMIGAGSEAA